MKDPASEPGMAGPDGDLGFLGGGWDGSTGARAGGFLSSSDSRKANSLSSFSCYIRR